MYIICLLFMAGFLLQGMKVLANYTINRIDNYYAEVVESEVNNAATANPSNQPKGKEVFMPAPLHQTA